MKKLILAPVLAVLIALGSIALAPAAFAGTATGPEGYSLTINDITYTGSGCVTRYYTFNPPTEYFPHWDAAVDVTAPDGSEEAFDYFYEDSGRSGSVILCAGIDAYGSHRVTIHFTGYDADYATTAESTASTSFRFSKPAPPAPKPAPKPKPVLRHVSLTAAKAKSGKHGWKVSTRLNSGGTALRARRVYLERKVRGRWLIVAPTSRWVKRTSRTGRATWTFAVVPPAIRAKALRLYVAQGGTTYAGNSRVFRLPRR